MMQTMESTRAASLRASEHTLATQVAARVAQRIDGHALKAGTRLPSIRVYAAEERVSRATVVAAYDRLIAAGYIESRRGSGFYVRSRRAPSVRTARDPAVRESARDSARDSARASAPSRNPALDVVWLLRSQLRQAPAIDHPGAGLLPGEWLDGARVAAAIRAVGRGSGSWLTKYGEPEGYLPLRTQLAQRLAQIEINAGVDQIVTVGGVTQGIDLVARHLVAPGDTVFVEDPAWYVMFARLVAFGAKLVGVPRGADGPDLTALAALLTRYQPKLFIMSSVLHNPTGTSMSLANAHRLLQLAIEYRFSLVEDDVYGDLHTGRPVRLASLDQLQNVIYIAGFSKTLAANLRVGYIATSAARARELAELKMLTELAAPELPERVTAKILIDGDYRRLVERVRGKLEAARERTGRALEKMGARLFPAATGGMFLWADFGRDTNAIAAAGAQEGILCAPGSLFSPLQLPSTWMRVAATTSQNPAAMDFLARAIAS